MTEIINFSEVMYDNDLHDYINGHIIYKSKNLNSKDEINNITKNIIIDYYLWKNNLDKNEYSVYSKIYDELLKDNVKTIDKVKKININLEKIKREEKEEEDYEEDKRLHYQSYFGRYKDIIYIIDYYKKLKEEEENKIYEFEEEITDVEEDEDDYYDEYYEDYYSEYENYDNYENEEDDYYDQY